MILEEGVRRLGVTPDQMDVSQAEVILKRLVYRELQAKMSPNAARGRIEELLRELGAPVAEKEKSTENKLGTQVKNVITELEAGLKRFNLYLDWPEVGRLRGLLGVIKQDPEASTVRSLIREGQDVLSQLEEKLQGALLRQTRDIAELQVALQKVQNVGGPKVRRLENLIRQIEEAHAQETLAQAEVERARSLAAEMRKLVESSVVQNPTAEMPITLDDEVIEVDGLSDTVELASEEMDIEVDLDFEALSLEQQSRIREIDVTEDRRRLEGYLERYSMVLDRPEVASELNNLQLELDSGKPLGERLGAFEAQLKAAHGELLVQAKVEYQKLLERQQNLKFASEKAAPIQMRLGIAQETLQAGSIPPELEEIGRSLLTLEAEERALQAARERQLQLEQSLAVLRTEAEASLAPFHGEDEVEIFLATLADLPASDEAIARARHSLSELLAQLAKEREEEGLKRAGYKATVQAIPRLEPLQADQLALLALIENPEASIEDIGRMVAAFVGQAKNYITAKTEEIEKQVQQLEQTLAESFPQLRSSIHGAREALAGGRITDVASLERELTDLVVSRRTSVGEELARYEVVARSMKGLGGEELEHKVQAAKAELQNGKFPQMSEIHGLLSRLRRSQEALRAELSGRIGALLEAYSQHKSVGGDTAFRLKPMCDFLQSAMDRLARLGAGGLLEVRRALEEAERLESQLEEEYKAARSVMSDLKEADLESLLDVFDTPQVPVASAPTPAPAAVAQTVANADLSADLQEALASFQIRGVEAVALLENGQILWGGLPISSSIPQSVFDDLRNLANELSSSAPQLSVISLPNAVMVLLPLASKGLVVLAEKALLSRILTQIEKHRDVLEKA